MDLNELYTLLNFYINKELGGWYSMEELTMVVDRAQRTLFNTYYIKYQTSQRLDDALAPFKADYGDLTTTGIFVNPVNYQDMLAITITVNDEFGNHMIPVEVVTNDELALRLNSQVNPVTLYNPIVVRLNNEGWQIYPKTTMVFGMTYLTIPRAPVFSYSLVSGRVIVYDPSTSVPLQWNDKDILSIIYIALNSLGINLSEADILQWSEMKSQQNFTAIPKA